MGKLIPLVCKSAQVNKGNNRVFTTPEVHYVNEDLIQVLSPISATDLTTVIETDRWGGTRQFRVYQKPQEIEVQRNPATTDVMLKQLLQLAVAGVGTTQATTLIMKYFNEMLTIGAGATEAGKMPVGVVNQCICVSVTDASGDPFKLFPEASGVINGAAANAVYNMPSGVAKFFVCTALLNWVVAIDRGR